MIIILGGGFIGAQLHSFLNNKYFNIKLVTKSDIDYSNEKILTDFLLANKPRFVINCSGYTGYPNVDSCETDRETCLKYNVQVPLNVCNVCTKLSIKVIHVSSGCIYNGYEKDYIEEDVPDFGIFNNESSFYSKTKHMFEVACAPFLHNTAILRVRMPFTNTTEHKNYLHKLYKYSNLINLKNSVTYLEDLNRFIFTLCQANNFKGGAYNVVSCEPVLAADIVSIFKSNGMENTAWRYVDLSELDIKANRSNCVLSNKKIIELGFVFPNAHAAIDKCIKDMKQLLV